MKNIIRFLLYSFLCLALKVNASENSNIGKEYYSNLNKGKISYYINKDIDSTIYYFHKAFSINKPFYQDYYRYAQIWNFENNYDSVYVYLVKSIELGCPELLFKNILYEEPFSITKQANTLKANLDFHRSKFLLDYNFKFVRFINNMLGKDQVIRINRRKLTNDIEKECYDKFAKQIDESNKNEFINYFRTHDFPDLRKVDYSTVNILSVFLNHYVTKDTNLVFTDSLFLIFKDQFDKGNMQPHVIVTPIDYSFMHFKKQIFGTYSSSLIENSKKVDSLNLEFGSMNIFYRNRIELITDKKESN